MKSIEKKIQSIHNQNSGLMFHSRYEISKLSSTAEERIKDFDLKSEDINFVMNELGIEKCLYEGFINGEYHPIFIDVSVIIEDGPDVGFFMTAKWYDLSNKRIFKSSTSVQYSDYIDFLRCVVLKRLSPETSI